MGTTGSKPLFGTVGVAMVTPFTPTGEIDLDSAAAMARCLVDDGCDMVLCSGTTGESPTTHRDEKIALIRAVREEVGNGIFILAGCGSNDTVHSVAMARDAEEAGADGLLLVSPYYSRPSQEGLYQHCIQVAQASALPIMLYDIPGRTGLAFADETLKRLAEFENIKAVKDATGKVDQGMARMRETGLQYYSGDDGLNFAWLVSGAAGVISVVGHVDSHSYRELWEAVDRGDLATARDISHRMQPIVHAIMGAGQGAVYAKEAAAMMGVISSPTVRLPFVNLNEEERAGLRAALAAHGAL
ncbi:MAG: 4-hydroxy-tetrahydrodipicolinate synthase [Varibaculum sp.]|nr:4-hydroxy-tetrahydrodipicolinate synthase [Varibaculum sp.]